MDEIGDFFNECTAAFTEIVVFVTGGLGLVDNTLNQYPPEQPCERVWGEESDLSCREEDNWKAYNNIKDIERPENDNDDKGSIFGLFGGGGNDDEESDSEFYTPASSVEESSGGWSIFGWSGSTEDCRVNTTTEYESTTDYNSYNSSSEYDSSSDYSSDYGGGSDSSSDYSSDYGGGSDSDGGDGGSDYSSDSSGGSDSGGDGGSWW